MTPVYLYFDIFYHSVNAIKSVIVLGKYMVSNMAMVESNYWYWKYDIFQLVVFGVAVNGTWNVFYSDVV